MVRAYFQLARWPNALLAAAGVIVGAWLALWTGGHLSLTHLLAAAGAAVALTITANAWNDAADEAIDRVAHPERPIPSGLITVRAARNLALAAAIAGVALATAAAPGLGAVSVAVAALMIMYSPWLKRTGLAGNLTVALLASLPFLYGAWAAGEPLDGLALVAWAFPLHLARELAKDIDDADGDAGHRATVPLTWGVPAARILAVGAIICFLVPLPLFTASQWLMLPMLPAVVAMVLAGYRLVRGRAGAAHALKLAMGLAMGGLAAALLLFGPSISLSQNVTTLFQALVLGVLQGVAEFLPISSSAHLALAPWLFGWPEPGLSFDVALHLGTLVAVLGYFRAEWIKLARAVIEIARTRQVESLEQKRAVFLVIATIPGAIGGLLLEKYAESVFRAPWLIAGALMVMGLVLWAVDRAAAETRPLGGMTARDALLVGVAQVFALIPGVSRSGSTMTAARALRFDRESAATFSFLMSMPIIAAAAVLKVPHLLQDRAMAMPLLVGVLASAVSGWFAIDALLRYLTRRSFGVFALYRLVLGAIVLALVAMRG